MVFAHLPASYILIKSADLLGYHASLTEGFLILAAGIVLDFDLLTSRFLKKTHHDLFTHTPFGIFLIWFGFIIIFGDNLSLTGKALILLSFLLHLLLDELNYWIYFWKTKKNDKLFEINWLYPLTKFKDRPATQSLTSFLCDYFREDKANVLLEVILTTFALLLFISK
jgi:hypothetical protein